MTVATTSNRVDYAGNGSTTSFATTNVVFFVASDLVVTLTNDTTKVETLQVLTTNYTVTGGAGSTGTVEMIVAPPTGTTLTIKRILPLTQLADYVNNDGSDAEVQEDVDDRGVMIDQQLQEQFDRTLTLASASLFTGLLVPDPVAQNFLRWKTDLSGLENVTLATTGGIVPTPVNPTDDGKFLSATSGVINWGGRNTYFLDSDDAGAAAGPILNLDRENGVSSIANDFTGEIRFRAEDDSVALVRMGGLRAQVLDPAAATFASAMQIRTAVGGAVASRVQVRNGMFMVGATGSDQGAGTFNATGLFIDGVAVSAGLQNLWETMAGDSGSAAASGATDTFTIAGAGTVSTAVSGTTLTITGATGVPISVADADDDTAMDVEQSADEDIIRFDTGDNHTNFPAQANFLVLSPVATSLTLPTANVATAAGGSVAFAAGAGNTSGAGGNFTIDAGPGGNAGAGGIITLNGGDSVTAGIGGEIRLFAGDSSGANPGALIRLLGGAGGINGAGGAVDIDAGDGGATTGGGGAFSASGGDGITSGAGGSASLAGGNAAGSSLFGGGVTLSGGLGSTVANGVGGVININSGNGRGTGAGGDLNLNGGNAAGSAGGGGDICIITGDALGAGLSGQLDLRVGAAGPTGDGAPVVIRAGAGGATSGDGADVTLEGGGQTSGADGIVQVIGAMGFQVNSAGTITSATDFDPDDGMAVNFTFGPAATAEIGFPTVKTFGMEMTVEVTNGGQGTLTWGAEVQWAGGSAPTLTAAGTDLLKFYTRDGGVTWMGSVVGLNFS